MTEDRFEIHQSMIGMRHRCEWQLVYRYGETLNIGKEDIIEPPGISAHVGTGVHRSVDVNLQQKIDKGELLHGDTVTDIAAQEFESCYADGVILTDEQAANPTQTKAEALDYTVKAAATHHMKVAPALDPVAVEEQWKMTIKGTPFDLAGRIDIREPTTVRDTKTSGMYPIKEALAGSFQLHLYALAVKKLHGEYPQTAHIDTLVKGRGKVLAVSYIPREALVTDHWGDLAMDRVNSFCARIKELQAGSEPQPADMAHPFVCTKAFCGYWRRCKHFSGRAK